MTKETRQKLIEALIIERNRMNSGTYNAYDLDYTIEYLGSGNLPENWKRYTILCQAVEDVDDLVFDYVTNPIKS